MVVALGIYQLTGLADPYRESATEVFSNLRPEENVTVNPKFEADIACAIPTGIDPFAFAKQKFPAKAISRKYDYDSDTRWYLVLVNDANQQVRILDIQRSKADLEADAAICSRDLILKKIQIKGRSVIRMQ